MQSSVCFFPIIFFLFFWVFIYFYDNNQTKIESILEYIDIYIHISVDTWPQAKAMRFDYIATSFLMTNRANNSSGINSIALCFFFFPYLYLSIMMLCVCLCRTVMVENQVKRHGKTGVFICDSGGRCFHVNTPKTGKYFDVSVCVRLAAEGYGE